MVAFEKSEAVRGLPFLKKGGTIVVDEREIYSLPVMIGAIPYPEGIIESLKNTVGHVVVLEATRIASELGNVRAQNIVLLGSLIAYLGLEGIDWKELVGKMVPAKARELNQKAFQAGFDFYRASVGQA